MKLRLFANHMLGELHRGKVRRTEDRPRGPDGLDRDRYSGQLPDWHLNASLSYSNGGLSIAVQERYISSGTLNATYTPADVDYQPRERRGVHRTCARPGAAGSAVARGYEIHGNVSNVFDKDPPLAPLLFGLLGSYPTNPGLFDTLGRRFTLGVNLRF